MVRNTEITLEQKRAKYSYNCVHKIKDKSFADKFKSLVKRTPILILTNGFGNTMAFLFSKEGDKHLEHLVLIYVIGKYLFEENDYTKKIFEEQNTFEKSMEDFLELLDRKHLDIKSLQNSIFQKLVFTEIDKYILATEETLRLLNWLKRFVEAMIEKG